MNASDIEFRPVRSDDLAMLGEWMTRPHWQEWWGDASEEIGFVRDMVEGRDTTRPYLFLIGGEPAGYVQAWFIGDHQNEQWIAGNPWLAELPSDTVGVDISIADPQLLGRGVGTAVVSAFTRMLLAEGHTNIIIDPDSANRRAVRAYEKAGFRPIESLLGRSGDSLIMQFHVKDEESK
jgi:RimJ/RimL family protein N-acetyltransferase